MSQKCRICSASTIKTTENGLALALLFPAPAFDRHMVVATSTHKDLIEVQPNEWQAIGELIGQLAREARKDKRIEKCYLVAIGDVDLGHFHIHVVPRRTTDPSLGPFVFGKEGWVSKR